jgi:hypothetical protein
MGMVGKSTVFRAGKELGAINSFVNTAMTSRALETQAHMGDGNAVNIHAEIVAAVADDATFLDHYVIATTTVFQIETVGTFENATYTALVLSLEARQEGYLVVYCGYIVTNASLTGQPSYMVRISGDDESNQSARRCHHGALQTALPVAHNLQATWGEYLSLMSAEMMIGPAVCPVAAVNRICSATAQGFLLQCVTYDFPYLSSHKDRGDDFTAAVSREAVERAAAVPVTSTVPHESSVHDACYLIAGVTAIQPRRHAGSDSVSTTEPEFVTLSLAMRTDAVTINLTCAAAPMHHLIAVETPDSGWFPVAIAATKVTGARELGCAAHAPALGSFTSGGQRFRGDFSVTVAHDGGCMNPVLWFSEVYAVVHPFLECTDVFLAIGSAALAISSPVVTDYIVRHLSVELTRVMILLTFAAAVVCSKLGGARKYIADKLVWLSSEKLAPSEVRLLYEAQIDKGLHASYSVHCPLERASIRTSPTATAKVIATAL